MKYNMLYPGQLSNKEVVLVSGGIAGVLISRACFALAEGIRSEGLTVSVISSGLVESYSLADQTGDPADWDYSADVILIDAGEYLGGDRFRYVLPPSVQISRTVFFTKAAERAIAHYVPTASEEAYCQEVTEYLEQYLPKPVTLAKPSLLSMIGAEKLLSQNNTEMLDILLSGMRPSVSDLDARATIASQAFLEQAPKLKRRLW
jgi:hypothetical protein